MVRAIIKGVLKIVSIILFRVEKIGEENIPKEGPCIICPNHTSNWDPPVIVAAIKRNDLYILAKEEMFVNKFIKWLAKEVHALPVKRGKQDTAVLKNSLKVLKNGNIILLFPEGTRNGMKKNGKLQNGAALMALRSGTPIIPVGIQGNYKPFRKVKINYGKPMDISKYDPKNIEKEKLDEISKELMDNIIMLTN